MNTAAADASKATMQPVPCHRHGRGYDLFPLNELRTDPFKRLLIEIIPLILSHSHVHKCNQHRIMSRVSKSRLEVASPAEEVQDEAERNPAWVVALLAEERRSPWPAGLAEASCPEERQAEPRTAAAAPQTAAARREAAALAAAGSRAGAGSPAAWQQIWNKKQYANSQLRCARPLCSLRCIYGHSGLSREARKLRFRAASSRLTSPRTRPSPAGQKDEECARMSPKKRARRRHPSSNSRTVCIALRAGAEN